jgi:Fe2+ transport system protein B
MPFNLFNRNKIQSPAPVQSTLEITGSIGERVRQGLYSGLRKGWDAFLWMAKILLPISLAVALLKWSGWLYKVDFVLNPVMNLINLPSEAAFPILSGLFINIYAAIAILTVVPFSTEQMTLIAVFTLVAHSVIVETIIQHKSGINGFKIVIIRILTAIITVLLISLFFGDTSQSVTGTTEIVKQETIVQALKVWGIDTGWLLLKILCIIMGIMITLECLRWLEWDRYLYRFFKPFMKVLGLSERTVILWVTAVLFGLMYGSAVILEKSKEGGLTRSELERLHISIGINHSMVEDPALYMALGINAFWLLVPKLLMAMIATQIYRTIEFMRVRRGGYRRV